MNILESHFIYPNVRRSGKAQMVYLPHLWRKICFHIRQGTTYYADRS